MSESKLYVLMHARLVYNDEYTYRDEGFIDIERKAFLTPDEAEQGRITALREYAEDFLCSSNYDDIIYSVFQTEREDELRRAFEVLGLKFEEGKRRDHEAIRDTLRDAYLELAESTKGVSAEQVEAICALMATDLVEVVALDVKKGLGL